MAELLHVSVACQVRVAVRVLPQAPKTLVTLPSTWTATLLPPQLLLAAGESKFQARPHATVLLAAQLMATPAKLVTVKDRPAIVMNPMRGPVLVLAKTVKIRFVVPTPLVPPGKLIQALVLFTVQLQPRSDV